MKRILPRSIAAAAFLGTVCLAAPPTFKLEIGPDTTRIKDPVLPDGTIDYAQAQRTLMAQGVTEKNNGATPLDQCLVILDKNLKALQKPFQHMLTHEIHKGGRAPWQAAAYPQLAKYLADSAAALDLAAEGAKRSKWSPPESIPPGAKPNDFSQKARIHDIKYLLVARMMQRIGADDDAGALADSATLHQLARLLGAAPTSDASWDAVSWDEVAWDADLIAIRHAKDSAAARKWLSAASTLSDLTLAPASIDVGIRYDYLDDVMQILRGNGRAVVDKHTEPEVADLLIGVPSGNAMNQRTAPKSFAEVDWNIVLRRINKTVDDAIVLAKEPDPAKLQAAWDKTMAPQLLLKLPPAEPPPRPREGEAVLVEDPVYKQVAEYLELRKGETREAFSERVAVFLLHSFSVPGELNLVARQNCRQRVMSVAMAIETYKLDKGGYPESLAPLAPNYLKELPRDPFTGKDFIYHRTADGYAVYRAGFNGQDDNGKGDDIAVIYPIPKPPPPTPGTPIPYSDDGK